MKTFTIAVTLALATGAVSAEAFMPWTEVMAKYDLNHDGGVSMEEAKDHKLGADLVGFQPFMVDHFAELDANGDGIVDSTELAKMMHTKAWTDKDMVNQFYKDTGFMPHNPANQ